MPPRRSTRAAPRATRPAAPRAGLVPFSNPQGRALYHSPSSPRPTPHAPRPHFHRATRARIPTFASGLSVARARVRDAPWDTVHWIELADILYKKGDFDLAATAYRRVQEICSPASGARKHEPPRATGLLERATQRALPPAIEDPGASPAAPAELYPQPPVAVPKVPVVVSASGQTRAIRLPGTNIMIAVTGFDTAPSPPTAPRRIRTEVSGAVTPATAPSAAPTRPPPKPTADQKIRSVLEQDLSRFLLMFERPNGSKKSSNVEAQVATDGADRAA